MLVAQQNYISKNEMQAHAPELHPKMQYSPKCENVIFS